MKRREFITLLGGAAAWPLAARAQQGDSLPRFVCLTGTVDDPDARARIAAFRTAFEMLGWTDGRNVRADYRSDAIPPGRQREIAAEVVRLP
jgi:putative ABC transport system substrate-binding protein